MEPIETLMAEIAAETRDTARWTGRDRLSPQTLRALRRVRRDRFVPTTMRAAAWVNAPLPIGHRQTISQPFIVALMTDLLALHPQDRVLEIGTGSGYQAAVLAELSKHVFSMETIRPLSEQAAKALHAEGYDRVQLRVGDGNRGWPEEAPFDAIIVTAAARDVPPELLAQLRDGGRMVIPVGEPNGDQELRLLHKKADGTVDTMPILPVAFVPLTEEPSI